MKIINRDQLATMPNGTVYALYEPDMITSNFHIICGRYDNKPGFNGVVSLEPYFNWEKNLNVDRITNWCSVDETDWEYDEEQLFAVFSKTEVKYMINVLMWALADCNYEDNFMDKFILGDIEIDEKDLSKWTDDTMGLI